MLDSLKYCQKTKGLEIYAWCIMTSHVHLIIGTSGNKMEDILRDFKSFTSRSLDSYTRKFRRKQERMAAVDDGTSREKEYNNNDYQFWQQDNHPLELWDNYMMDQKLEYLHMNPISRQAGSLPL